VKVAITQLFDGHSEITALWFETLLHYSLVSTVSEEYYNFDEIGAAALLMLAHKFGIDMDVERARNVLKPMLSAQPYPDVLPSLKKLKESGFRIAALTNSSKKSMETQLKNAGLDIIFDRMMSVEEIGMYKPKRDVYQWASREMGTRCEQSLFVAAHGWDIAGAQSVGMKTAFI